MEARPANHLLAYGHLVEQNALDTFSPLTAITPVW
jgi:hypothetical protein